MEWPRFIKNASLVSVYLVALVTVVLFLFFPVQLSSLKSLFSGVTTSGDMQGIAMGDRELRVSLVQYPEVLEPTSLDVSTRTLALQMYEPLVRTDEYLKIEPALALSWGRVSPTAWRFELRPNVVFHDNRPLSVTDVVASFARANSYKNSDLKAAVQGITIEPKSGSIFYIHTAAPDPLLLQKISQVLIIPKENQALSSFVPVGTGPYKFVSTKPRSSFSLTASSSYWDTTPSYQKLTFLFFPRREDREKALIQGDVDIATGVPPESIQRLTNSDLKISVLPSLEVNFLTFNTQQVFKNPELREAVAMAIDTKTFVDFSLGYATAVSQYVSSGVYGYNPKIQKTPYDLERATALVRQYSSFDLVPITLQFAEGLETAGDYIAKQLRAIGFDPKVTYLPWSDFRDGLANNTSDISFFGWRSDLGSVRDFYLNAVHTRDAERGVGLFNAGHFSDPEIDTKIDQAVIEFDDRKRLAHYQSIMQKLVDQRYGVPLFESQAIYASSHDVVFQPRIDGYIVASDVH